MVLLSIFYEKETNISRITNITKPSNIYKMFVRSRTAFISRVHLGSKN